MKPHETTNRIGRILEGSSTHITIAWSTDGLKRYAREEVPPEVATAQITHIVHALFKRDTEEWLSVWIEPPYSPEEYAYSENMKTDWDSIPNADWPKIKEESV